MNKSHGSPCVYLKCWDEYIPQLTLCLSKMLGCIHPMAHPVSVFLYTAEEDLAAPVPALLVCPHCLPATGEKKTEDDVNKYSVQILPSVAIASVKHPATPKSRRAIFCGGHAIRQRKQVAFAITCGVLYIMHRHAGRFIQATVKLLRS